VSLRADFPDPALEAAREAKYRDIRDLELDYRTGKLSNDDYRATDAVLRVEALAILDRIQDRERSLQQRERDTLTPAPPEDEEPRSDLQEPCESDDAERSDAPMPTAS
jgi:hypothetical protein